VRATLDEIAQRPGMEGVGFRYWQDQSEGILEVLRLLTEAGLSGGLLAVVVLFLFLRRLKPTFIVAMVIPISLIVAIPVLYFGGESLNIITLSGLMLAVGMLIDNAVVRSEEHTSELQSRENLVCRLLLEKKKHKKT